MNEYNWGDPEGNCVLKCFLPSVLFALLFIVLSHQTVIKYTLVFLTILIMLSKKHHDYFHFSLYIYTCHKLIVLGHANFVFFICISYIVLVHEMVSRFLLILTVG